MKYSIFILRILTRSINTLGIKNKVFHIRTVRRLSTLTAILSSAGYTETIVYNGKPIQKIFYIVDGL